MNPGVKTIETIVIMPNFNGLIHLDECLKALREQSYKNFKTLIVDDCSSDDSVEFIKKNFPEVDILQNEKNISFAPSINKGIRYGIERYNVSYVAPLNNDTHVNPEWLMQMVAKIESEPNLCAVAANMIFYDQRDTINSQGGYFDKVGNAYDLNWGKKIADQKEVHAYVLAPCFGACLIKTSTLKDIGLLDERYASYWEDLDWGWRANVLGYKVAFAKDAVLYHKGSATWKKFPARKMYLCLRNAKATIIKNAGLSRMFKLLFITFFADLVMMCRELLTVRFWLHKIPYQARLARAAIVPRLWFWNIANLPKTLALRWYVQSRRKTRDSEIFKLVQYDHPEFL